MAVDPRKLRPGELCRLLNSTPLGEVIGERVLRSHRTRAGMRIGDGTHVDLLRYTAWLVTQRHASKTRSAEVNQTDAALSEAAEAAAGLGTKWQQMARNGQLLSGKQELLIAALLTEQNHAAAARKAGVGLRTLYRWLHLPAFRAAYRQARRELVEAAVGRLQAGTGQAVETLIAITSKGRRDGDRIRAAVALLDHACRGLADADTLHGTQDAPEAKPMNTTDVVAVLATRLRQLDQAELSTIEKTRLTATLVDALLRAIGVDVLDKRLEALQAVLLNRKEKKR